MQVLVGADPELFLQNPNSKEFISAHTYVPGTKYEPWKVKAGAIQVDGTALEFNIDPAATAEEFVRNIATVQESFRDWIPPGYQVVAEPAVVFQDNYFKSLPESALELGCEPDFNAYTGEANPRPDGSGPMRTGSGHVHVGWTSEKDVRSTNHLLDCRDVVKQMDYALGIHSLLWDPDNRRRSMYGMAGAFRPKSYGVEYRVLSNRWLASPALQTWIFDTVQKAMRDLASGRRYFSEFGEDLAQSIINKNEVDWPTKYAIDLGIKGPPLAA